MVDIVKCFLIMPKSSSGCSGKCFKKSNSETAEPIGCLLGKNLYRKLQVNQKVRQYIIDEHRLIQLKNYQQNGIMKKNMILKNITTQPFKFRTKICVELNDDARETCNTNSQIKFKTPMLKSTLYD